MVAQQAFYTCPDCGAQLEAHSHPFIWASISHKSGCLLNDGNDPDYRAALRVLFDGREVITDGGEEFLSAESAEGNNMIVHPRRGGFIQRIFRLF